MDSPWTQLSHIPGKVSRPPKIMTAAEMLAPLSPPLTTDDEQLSASVSPSTTSSSSSVGNQEIITNNTTNISNPPEELPPFIDHPVTKSDTLFGLPLKYNISIAEIKRINDLATDNISYLKIIKIPRGNYKGILPNKDNLPDSKRSLVRKLKNTYNLSEAEAKYYLDLVDYNYELACKEYQQDEEFEIQNQQKLQQVITTTTTTTNNKSSNTTTNNNNPILSKLSSFFPTTTSSSLSSSTTNIPKTKENYMDTEEIQPLSSSSLSNNNNININNGIGNNSISKNKEIIMENSNNPSNSSLFTLRKRK